MSDPARIYQLKIELPYIKPSIWRRLEVRGQMTFSDLHNAIQILEAMANPKHPEHDEMLEWIGEEWDPEAFDLDAVNAVFSPRRRKSAKRARK